MAAEQLISTHAPLAGRDSMLHLTSRERLISTHAPLAGRDQLPSEVRECDDVFQPTRPLRGATSTQLIADSIMQISTHAPLAGRDPCVARFHRHEQDFNPRAPCGARPVTTPRPQPSTRNFNPRAPCGARPTVWRNRKRLVQFQPTRPLRGATGRNHKTSQLKEISTHAPLAGRDPQRGRPVFTPPDFNPRAPCGARQIF